VKPRARLALTAAVALACAAAGKPDARYQILRLTIGPDARDTFLPAPIRADLWFELDAANAPPKSRIMFLAPLPAGRHRLHVDVHGNTADRTFVLALPLGPGHSRVELAITGAGRFDLGFFAGAPNAPAKEYRYTVTAPIAARTFEVDLP
jgi:hypothetical protein